ncbi:MAG: hypothetical protein MJA29_00170, partial [Candidatus Omnitrophica bacterium]|nr:hypothetical protein [Candidatus Omnitrophota bacterium]
EVEFNVKSTNISASPCRLQCKHEKFGNGQHGNGKLQKKGGNEKEREQKKTERERVGEIKNKTKQERTNIRGGWRKQLKVAIQGNRFSV